jgi:hypothetical protein
MMAIDCDWVERNDGVSRYVGGRLGDSEVEGFETHCLSCERCWPELRAAVELRDAAGVEFVARPVVRPRLEKNLWTLLAAAAAVAVMAIGLRDLTRRAEEIPRETVYRSIAGRALALVVQSNGSGDVELSWTPVPDAEKYALEIVASDGTTVLERETSTPSIRLDGASIPEAAPSITYFATVEARDSMQQVLARSERTKVSRP